MLRETTEIVRGVPGLSTGEESNMREFIVVKKKKKKKKGIERVAKGERKDSEPKGAITTQKLQLINQRNL